MSQWRESTIEHVQKEFSAIKTSSELDKLIKEWYEKGLSYEAIADRLHLKKSTICRHCKSLHIPGRPCGGCHIEEKTYKFEGEDYTINELVKLSSVDGLTPKNLRRRIEDCKWSVRRALETPIMSRKHPCDKGYTV